MFKQVPNSWDFGDQSAIVLKRASCGFRGADKQHLVKSAGEFLADTIAKLPNYPDERLVLLNALGTTESVGPNRKGDGFREETHEKYHDTFVKSAKFYRDHENTDPQKSYGIVRHSHFNKPMGRTQLVVALNAEKSAADRNKGLVADLEIAKLDTGDDLPVSMSTFVPYDVCSYCMNKAANRHEYCDSPLRGGLCKAGGLKHNIGKLVEVDGKLHQLHADNPIVDWMDISHVWRPADPTAFVMGELRKVAYASCQKLAAQPPRPFVRDFAQLQTVAELADIERTVSSANNPQFAELAKYANAPAQLPADTGLSLQDKLTALRERGICLPLSQFLKVATGCDSPAALIADIGKFLPGIYNRWIKDGVPAGADNYKSASISTAAARWAKQARAPQPVDICWSEKTAEDPANTARYTDNGRPVDSAAADLAQEYALYKLAFFEGRRAGNAEFALTALSAILQNYHAR